VATAIASTHYAYTRKDGQAELTWVAMVTARKENGTGTVHNLQDANQEHHSLLYS